MAQPFVFDGREIAQRRVAALWIVQAFDEAEDGHPSPLCERKRFRSSSSHPKLSQMALSQTSPTEPVEGLTPASLQRLPKASEVHRKPRTLFRSSSGDAGGVDLLMALHDEGDDLTGEVAFGADGAELGMPIGNAPGDELPRPLISPQPTDRDDMRGAIGAAVAAAVQAMPDCLAGRCRNGTDTAKRGDAGFRAHAFWIVARAEAGLPRQAYWPDAETLKTRAMVLLRKTAWRALMNRKNPPRVRLALPREPGCRL